MRALRFAAVVFLLGALTVQADPFKDWDWTAPTQYENDLPIPATDDLSYNLYCGTVEGGPYDDMIWLLDEPPPTNVDMGPLVANTPGTYYCVVTATSSLWLAESAYSNEANFTVLSGDLGYRPKPPVLSLGGG